MDLEYTRTVSKQYMSATGKVVKKYRINLKSMTKNSLKAKWMLMKTKERDTSIYDIII